jgi:hypothetical protein
MLDRRSPMRFRVLNGALALALVAGLSACAAEEEPVEEPSALPTQTAEPEPEQTTEPERGVFSMPSDCTEIFPQARLDSFASQNLVLRGGPGSPDGNDAFFDPTPEQQAGGISCIWANPDGNIADLLISVAPLSAATRPGVVNGLTAQGLNETRGEDGTIIYGQFGDEQGAPAIYNEVMNESWISIISAFGGQVFYDEAVEFAAEIRGEVYQ